MYQEQAKPLVSIGIPTYNRPEGLRRALESITGQTYKNLEIIVSDNCSLGEETQKVVQEFMEKDSRIQYHRQVENKGGAFNFRFVLERANGEYFMWMADDYVWDNNTLIEKLLDKSRQHTLAFPDFNLSFENGSQKELFFKTIYSDCNSSDDYLYAFASNGAGYPFYGMYNLEMLRQQKMEFIFDIDLKYFGEGCFLHRLFINGKVCFVFDVSISVSVNKPVATTHELFKDFPKYCKRALSIYFKSNLPIQKKTSLLLKLYKVYNRGQNRFFSSMLYSNVSWDKKLLYTLSNPLGYIIAFPMNNIILIKFIGRTILKEIKFSISRFWRT